MFGNKFVASTASLIIRSNVSVSGTCDDKKHETFCHQSIANRLFVFRIRTLCVLADLSHYRPALRKRNPQSQTNAIISIYGITHCVSSVRLLTWTNAGWSVHNLQIFKEISTFNECLSLADERGIWQNLIFRHPWRLCRATTEKYNNVFSLNWTEISRIAKFHLFWR